MYQKDLKETKWRRDRIGIARARETERGKREIKNAGAKDREEEKERERREWTKSCSKSASANCKKDTEEKERGGERRGEHIYIPVVRIFPFSARATN